MVERAAIFANESTFKPQHLELNQGGLSSNLNVLEEPLIFRALEVCGGNIFWAARWLCIHCNKLKTYSMA